MTEATPVIVWFPGSRRRALSLAGKEWFFIGRPLTPEEVKFDPRDHNVLYRVFIYEPYKWAVDTEIDSYYASRRHLKVTLDQGKIILQNHGSKGRGTSNQTYIDYIPIGKEPFTRVLDPCGEGRSISVKLSSFGPEFIFACMTEEGIHITLDAGRYTTVPRPLAVELENAGVADQIYGSTGESVVYVKDKPTVKELRRDDLIIRVVGSPQSRAEQAKLESLLRMLLQQVDKIKEIYESAFRMEAYSTTRRKTRSKEHSLPLLADELEKLLAEARKIGLDKRHPQLYKNLVELKDYVRNNIADRSVLNRIYAIIKQLELTIKYNQV